MPPKLGLLAGGGVLPARLIEALHAGGRDLFVIALEGHCDPETVAGVAHVWARLGAASDILDRLHRENVSEIVFAGRVRRPSWTELRPDWRAAKFLTRIVTKAIGDDGLLRAVSAGLEEEGFRVVAVQDLLSDLLVGEGPVGSWSPDIDAEADIARGIEVARGLGVLDVGQAVVVQQGLVLGVEAIEGTDALINRCGALRREGPGGVLVKMRKPKQDHRLDLPTIGETTVAQAAAAGLRGIVVEAGGSLILGRAAVAAAADRVGLFVIGVKVQQP
ncbi:UDP-2,3-diacylglucosamine pyrophosphatase LpxI [uncultured Gammaproteobacteria bacterium]